MAKITDSKDIIDIAKLLEKKEKEYKNSDAPYGMELLTIPQYISSARSIMFTSHLKQMLTLNYPEFPRMCTNYENIFGKYSSSIHKAKEDSEVVKIIDKFPKVPGHRYVIFFYNKKKNYYDCVIKEGPEELTEKFGYGFNTDVLDNLKVGDAVAKGETLYKSKSYDEDDNYCFGVNARTLYLIDNETIEDAVVVSESFAKRMESKEVETVKIGINDNDLLDNLYGDDKYSYKGFPDIGEKVVNKLICSKRQINNDQTLFDLKKSNLRESNPVNDKEYYSSGTVIDINIYSNKTIEEIPDIACNGEILYYLKNQQRYYTELKDYCDMIVNSGAKYCADISFLLGRAEHILDPNYRWKDDDNAFSYMIMEITVERDVPARIGYKLTGRYGNKGVISKIHPDNEMPIDEDGKPVDLIINSLSVINRLNSAQLFEISINHISNGVAKHLNTLKTLKQKEDLLFDYVGYFNEGGECDQLKKYYKTLNTEEKKDFFAEINKSGIFINLPPVSRGKPLFDIIYELYQRYPFITMNTMYINKWGRRIRMMHDVVCGEEYIIKLKQTAKKNFSARSTGYLSQKGLPDKSNKSKHNQQLYPTTPIKIGRDENNNLSIGVSSKTLAKFHLFYRSSPVGRREMSKLLTCDPLNFKGFKIKKEFTNRNVEILLAYLKSMGYAINYGERSKRVRINSDMKKSMKYKGTYYVGTEKDFKHIILTDLYKQKFNEVAHVGPAKWVKKQYDQFVEDEEDKAVGRFRVRINKPMKY